MNLARGGLVLLLASVAILITEPTQAKAQAGCKARSELGSSSFRARVCDLPDYDQRRLGGTIRGDGREFTFKALKGNGGCHCVPTSLLDLIGYYEYKGVKTPLSSYPWWSRKPADVNEIVTDESPVSRLDYLARKKPYPSSEVYAYSTVQDLLSGAGKTVEVGSGKCGTNYEKVADSFLNLYGKKLGTALTFGWADTSLTTPQRLAQVMANGGVAAVAYGRYEDYEENGTKIEVGDRVGGHSIAVAGVWGKNASLELRFFDPNTTKLDRPNKVYSGDDRFRQSLFGEPRSVQLKRMTDGGDVYYRFGKKSDGETQALIDGYMVVYPMYVVTVGSGNSVKVVSAAAFNTNGKQATASASVPRASVIKADSRILDAAVLGTSGEVVYVQEGSNKITAVVPVTGDRRTLGTAPAGTTDIETDPTGGRVFALAGRKLTTLSSEGQVLDRATLPAAAQGLAYDWSSDSPWKQRLAVVSKGERRAWYLRADTLKAAGRVQLPKSVRTAKGDVVAGFTPNGKLEVRAGKQPTRGGLVTTDQGTDLTVRNGRTAVVGGGSSPLAGLDVGDQRVVAVSHTGAQYTRAQAGELIDGEPLDEEQIDPDRPDADADADTHGPADGDREPHTNSERVPDADADADRDPTATATATATASPTATPVPKPNLVVEQASGTVALIRNVGTVAAGPFRVSVSRPRGVPDTEDVPGLAAGQAKRVTYTCAAGQRTVLADSQQTVDESSESDNALTFQSVCSRWAPTLRSDAASGSH